ncbi:MAG: hypothetical protein MI810_08325 [Flavobacteriales bacterium]|nr:hypothetical protein [Flavobacteriales bacterium]
MAIDQMMLGPMLDSFKNMAQDCTDKGYSGPAYDRMMEALNRMETLGQEMNDFMEYSAKITAEGLQMTFSNAYGEVLAEAAKPQGGNSDGGYDDGALLQQSLNALRDAVQQLKNSEKQAIDEARSKAKNKKTARIAENELLSLSKNTQLIGPIEDLISLGESGVNFPTFLRTQIEKGLDKAMEGSAVVRDGLAYSLDFAQAAASHPYDIKIKEEQIAKFDELGAKARFGIPESFQINLEFDAIEHRHSPAIAKWKAIEDAWERIISSMDTWAIAHCSFAPYIDPWAMASNPKEAVQSSKDCLPGDIKEWLRLLNENFGLDFHAIFQHETFKWSVQHHHFSYSQEYTEFLIKTVFPQCQPGQFLDAETTSKVEALYKEEKMNNPENYKVLDRSEVAYDKHFGQGKFLEKIGSKGEWGQRNAAPWNLESFLGSL